MVGLKTFWILISALFLFSACVPSTKQTECGTNEAFNSSLRACVPVVQGPDAFILINSYTPLYTTTAFKFDVDPIEFKITVSNPYGQAYTIEWERVFNGLPVAIGTNSPTYLQYPSLLSSQVGTHIITAKIKNSSGTIVDTHSFQLKIDDEPKPTINTTTLNPSSYVIDVYPTDAPQSFNFTVRNNNADTAILNVSRISWTVTKNGAAYYSETDAFTNFTPSGTNNAYLGTSPVPYFDPAVHGVGNYVIRAVVENTFPGEVVDSFQWNVNVRQPDLANVTTIAQPAPGVTITAHDGVSYNAYPTYSWIHTGTTKPNFCVTIDDRDGTYSGDGKSIQVRFYLNSLGGDICTKKTLDTPGSQTICLIDANNCDPDGANVPFDTTILKFANASSTAPQVHKVTARLFDEATTLEFQRSDVVPSNGSYPIEWVVNNQPVNVAPALSFGATQPTGCTSAGAFTRTGCQVSQGTNFTVSFVVKDDFYSGIANAAEFLWDVRLKYNGTDVSSPPTNTTCTKAFGTAVTVPAASGPATAVTGGGQQWTCTLAVPHFISTGPLNPSVGSYSVVASMQDSGSPVGGAGLISQSLTWNLVVTETNPSGISVSPQSTLLADSHVAKGVAILDPADVNSYATELDTVTFRLNVTDNELDDFKYRISLCTLNTPSTCTSSTPITSPSYVDFLRSVQVTPATNPVLVPALLYTLPEDLLLQVSPQLDVNLTTSAKVYFKVDVIDTPSVPLTAKVTDTEIFGIYVRNYNPAPVVNTATASPAVGSTSVVYSGYQFTIDPGIVTDASGPTTEKNIQYQWYSKIGAGAWTAIAGATSEILKYTPGNITSNIDIKLCVGDRPAANPISPAGNCSGSWTVTPKKYLETLSATGIGGQVVNELATWYDDTNVAPNTRVIYSAYTDDANYVYVEKTIKNAAGNINISTQTIRFYGLNDPTFSKTAAISNISISGSTDSVYVAYLASHTNAPSTMYPRVRRIDKKYIDSGFGDRPKTGYDHPAPFGFNYSHYTLSSGTVACSVCTFFPGDGAGLYARIRFSAAIPDTEEININGVILTASSVTTGPQQICNAGVCPNANSTALNIANKINASTLPGLQGITAINSGDDLLLFSQYHNDFVDSQYPALTNGLGKIFVAGGRWYLPFIDTTEDNNITVISGQSDVHLNSAAPDAITLGEMGKTALFDAQLNASGELVFARISADLSDSGTLALFRYDNIGQPDLKIFDAAISASPTDQNAMFIFGTYMFESVKLAASTTGNPYYYVIAKERALDGGEYHIGRYHPEFDTAATPSENFLSTRISTTDSTDDVITDAKLKSPEIIAVPGFSEARIFFHSVGLGATPFPRVAQWRADDTVRCGTCDSLNGTSGVLASSKIGISQVATNITLGTAGATAGENIRDLVFTLFSSDIDPTATFTSRAQLGIINIEPEVIQSTTIDGTGMWRPPFVLD
ncbi:hypothetical protein ACJVC5_17910 [Peredibacter sp. HCB2-198]|uniref:hypothetical protein n=1 Tax=Peredibacter sp. HCB2-198 TaxID=3383025 RepID=UPI0038B53550